MRSLGRALAVSAAMWLVAMLVHRGDALLQRGHDDDAHEDDGDFLGDERNIPTAHRQQRHVDTEGMLDASGVVGKLGETLSHAGRVLGLHIADAVADLVSSAFSHGPHPPAQAQGSASSSWTRGDPGVLDGGLQDTTGSSAVDGGAGVGGGAVAGILRLLGLDSSKLGAIALNGIIFLAQLISSSLIGRPATNSRGREATAEDAAQDAAQDAKGPDHRGRHAQAGDEGDDDDDDDEPAGSPLSWVLNSPALKGSAVLTTSQSPGLEEKIIEEIQDRFPRPGGRRARRGREAAAEDGVVAADTSCLQLLVCKAGPFLRGMQRSLRPVLESATPATPATPRPSKGDPGSEQDADAAVRLEQERWQRLSPVQRMFAYMPAIDEVMDQAALCAQRYPRCRVTF